MPDLQANHALWFCGAFLALWGLWLGCRRIRARRARHAGGSLWTAAAIGGAGGLAIVAASLIEPPTSKIGLEYAAAAGIVAFAAVWFVVEVAGVRQSLRTGCPNCGYDLSGNKPGATMICPECGTDAGDLKKRNRRTRNRRAIVASLLLGVVGYLTPSIWHTREGGIKAMVPTWAMVAGFWWLPEEWVQNTLDLDRWTLYKRIHDDQLSKAQIESLERKAIEEIMHPTTMNRMIRATTHFYHAHLVMCDYATAETYLWCMHALGSSSAEAQFRAADWLWQCIPESEGRAWPSIAWKQTLRRIPEVREPLLGALDSNTPVVFKVAALLLAEDPGARKQAASAILSQYDSLPHLPSLYGRVDNYLPHDWSTPVLVHKLIDQDEVVAFVHRKLDNEPNGIVRQQLVSAVPIVQFPESIRTHLIKNSLESLERADLPFLALFSHAPNRDIRAVEALLRLARTPGLKQCKALLCCKGIEVPPDQFLIAVEAGLNVHDENPNATLAAIDLLEFPRAIPPEHYWLIRLRLMPFYQHDWSMMRRWARKATVAINRAEFWAIPKKAWPDDWMN